MLKLASIDSSGISIEVEQRPGLDQESVPAIARKNDAAIAEVLTESAPHPFIEAVRERCVANGERYNVRTKEAATAGLQVVDYLCWVRWREHTGQTVPLHLRDFCTGGTMPALNDAPVTIERYRLGI